jgi:hypothetical protein
MRADRQRAGINLLAIVAMARPLLLMAVKSP